MGELGVFENVTLKPLYYLSGPDGAGKTTALGMAVAHLTAQGDRVKTLYGLNRFLRYVGKRTKWAAYRFQGRASDTTFRQFVARGGGHEDRDPGSLTWRLRKGTLLALGLADVQLGYALALGYRAMGYTVVVETSPFDLFVKALRTLVLEEQEAFWKVVYHLPSFFHNPLTLPKKLQSTQR